jgi:ResB-like family
MSDISVQAAPSAPPPSAAPAPEAPPAPQRKQPSLAYRALVILASLRLTVALFVLSLLLVFFGTLAQIDSGIWTAVKDYFRSFYVWVPFQLFVRFGQVFAEELFSKELQVGGSFPFPAGWTLGGLLLVNLVAAHVVRFKLTWKRAGIYVLHAGLIVLLLGELVTGVSQVEASMTMAKGETVNYTDVRQNNELAITTPNPNSPREDLVVTVPQHLLARPGRISDPQLPFDVEVKEFWKNSSIIEPSPDRRGPMPNPRKSLDGRTFGLTDQREGSGVDTEAREDMPAMKVSFYRKDGGEQLGGEMLLSLWYYPNSIRRIVEFPPQTVRLDDKAYTVELRPKREYKPHSIRLLEFRHDLYPGTNKPKNFSSLVEVMDDKGQRREVKIHMNNPMWYGGETYYQQAWLDGDTGTVLQVVRNPGWFMPYLSCCLVTLGMLVHFGTTLVNFLQRRAAA